MAKTEQDHLSDAGLEAFFEAGRAQAPQPSDALMQRIIADAEAELRAGDVVEPVRAARPRPSIWAGLLAGLGGWPALAGMATATVAGVWIGFAEPDSLNTLSGGLLLPDSTASTSYDYEDMLPGIGDFSGLFEEG